MRVLLLAFALLVASSTAAQTDHTPLMRIDPNSGADRGEDFGAAMSVDGDRMAVGTPRDYSGGESVAGSVYIYERRDTVWFQTDRLTAPSPRSYGRFGEDLELDGDRLAISAPGESATYVYTYDGTWELSETIRFRTGSRNGMAVALQEDRLVIGEPGIYPARGRVYVMDHGPRGWSLSATLAPPTNVYDFGYNLELDGDRLIVTRQQQAYVYEFQDPGWELASTLSAFPNNVFDRFARLSGNRIVTIATAGAYVFEWDGTAWARFSLPPTPVSRSNPRTRSLDVDGNRIAVGVTYSGPDSPDHVVLFEESDSGWAVVDTVPMERPDFYDRQWDTIVLEGKYLFGAAKDGELFRRAESSGTVQIVSLDSTASRVVIASESLPTPEQMGRAVSSDGSRLAVATLETTRVYRLTASKATLEDTLPAGGTSVALNGTQLLIGDVEDQRISFYTLGSDGWRQTATFRGGDQFGTSVALDGGLALVGSPARGAAEVRAYAFDGSRWAQTATLEPPDAPASPLFGTAVALDGGRALVGDPEASNANGTDGAAYVFELAGGAWTLTTRAAAPDASRGGQFGAAVAISGGLALVGAPQGSRLTSTPGTVYALTGTSWTPASLPIEGEVGPGFGTTLALDGNRAAVGGYIGTGDHPIPERVVTYAFGNGAWTQTQGLVPERRLPSRTGFGSGIAISGRTVVVGAPYDDWVGPDAGTVYVYESPFVVDASDEGPLASSHLHPAAPNPFWDRSQLTLSLHKPEWVTVTVVDVQGRTVQTLLSGQRTQDTVTLTVDGRPLAAGLYLVRAVGETFTAVQPITLLR